MGSFHLVCQCVCRGKVQMMDSTSHILVLKQYLYTPGIKSFAKFGVVLWVNVDRTPMHGLKWCNPSPSLKQRLNLAQIVKKDTYVYFHGTIHLTESN